MNVVICITKYNTMICMIKYNAVIFMTKYNRVICMTALALTNSYEKLSVNLSVSDTLPIYTITIS